MTLSTTKLPATWMPRDYRTSDDEEILSVLQSAFPRWPNVDTDVPALDHLRWKLRSHPVAVQFHSVGEIDGQIAMPRIMMVQPIRFQGERRLAFQPVDVAVAPAFRGLGLAERMISLENRSVNTERYTTAFGIKLYIRGWTAAHRVIRPRLGSNNFAYGNRFIALEREAAKAPPNTIDNITIRRVDQFDERVNGFWEVASRLFVFAIDRTFEYLTWRYDPRAGRFAILLAEEGSNLLGYAVATTSRGRGYIADIVALPGHLDVARSLLANALSTLSSADVTAVECWLPTRHPYQLLLRELGFVRAERKLRFRYTPVGLSKEQLDPLRRADAALHLTAGDTDLV
jgi:ribosomal protein S18 acetylase RimI-like enzyme